MAQTELNLRLILKNKIVGYMKSRIFTPIDYPYYKKIGMCFEYSDKVHKLVNFIECDSLELGVKVVNIQCFEGDKIEYDYGSERIVGVLIQEWQSWVVIVKDRDSRPIWNVLTRNPRVVGTIHDEEVKVKC